MLSIFTSDEEPRREERADLGGGLAFSLVSNKLRAIENNSSPISHALSIYMQDHLDIASQQNKTARVLRLVMAGGFLMVTANIVVMSEVSSITTRVVLGGASVVGLSLVYYFRSTILPVNRDLLAQRKAIRTSAALIDQRERDIEMLRPLLNSDPENFLAIMTKLQNKKPLG
jgi:hypothetical protein